MTTVVRDLIAESSIEETRDGLTATRVFVVEGVGGAAGARLALAIRDSNIPAYGDAHPNIPDIQVVHKSARPIDMETFHVLVTYQQTDSLDVVGGRETIEVGSTPSTRQTSRDYRGLQLTKQVVIEDVDDEGNVTTRTETRVAEIEEEVALVTYIVRRREYENPARNAMYYTNSVSGNWKCSRIFGSSDDGGVTYNVTYELIYNPNGWDVVVEDRDDAGRIILGSVPEVFTTGPRRGLPVTPILNTLTEDNR